MFGTWISYWTTLSVVLAAVIVTASLAVSRRRYWIAVISFAAIAFGSCSFVIFPMVLEIRMENAFHPGSVSPIALIRPLIDISMRVYPALSLFPFMSAACGRKIVLAIAGIVVLFSVGSFISDVIRWGQGYIGDRAMAGIMAIFYLLLWLRVYDLRIATDPK